MANLKSMNVSQLLSMRSDIDKLLQSKRDELHSQLKQIGGFSGDSASFIRGAKTRGSVAPKYRHPETGQTWSGRGGTIGWLAAELKGGKKKEDFLVEGADKKPAKGKKAQKPKKKVPGKKKSAS